MPSKGMLCNRLTSTLLNKCMHQVFNVSKCIREVPYVTALVQLLPVFLNRSIATRYYDGSKLYRLKFSGTLIHGEPIVQFFKFKGGRVGCELGDMMVICKDYKTNRQTAAFLQAKVSKRREVGYTLSGPSSLNQLYLYTKWPKFSLKWSGSRLYDLYPKCADERARHMIFRHWRQPNVMIAKSQNVMPITYPSLGVYLMQILKMQEGREFFDPSHGDAWSELIKDVSTYISNHMFQRCRSLDPNTQFPRVSQTEIMSFISAKSNESVLSNNLVGMIKQGVKDLPEWAYGEKCFGILTIEKHFEGHCSVCEEERMRRKNERTLEGQV